MDVRSMHSAESIYSKLTNRKLLTEWFIGNVPVEVKPDCGYRACGIFPDQRAQYL